MNHSLCLHVSAMAVLELLTATAWAWIVRTRHALCTVWSAVYFCVLASILVGCCLLSCTFCIDVNLALYVVLLGVLLWCCLLNLLLLFHYWNLTTHQDAADAVVHVVDHAVPDLGTLQLEDQQWILLLVAGILYRVAEFIELAKVLLPVVINHLEDNVLLEFLHNALSLALVSLLQVACDVVHTLAVCDRHHDALIHSTLVLINLLDDRHSCSLDALSLALEYCHSLLESTLSQLVASAVLVLILCEWNLHSKNLQELFLGTGEVVVVDDV